MAATSGPARTAIRPWQIRSRQFRSVCGITGRGGLYPADVAAFLDRVAHDLAIVYAELERTWEQNDRIKDALRRWQSSHAPTATPSGYR
jgi:DivIVA domain-containing protein